MPSLFQFNKYFRDLDDKIYDDLCIKFLSRQIKQADVYSTYKVHAQYLSDTYERWFENKGNE